MSAAQERCVVDNTLSSTHLPILELRIDAAYRYVGQIHFVLYGAAQVDVFLFVVDDQLHIRRLLIVQFEGYLPDNEHTYSYPVTRTIMLGSHEYILDMWQGPLTAILPQRPDSDTAHVMSFLRDKGYWIQDDIASLRFVRVVDDAKRNEVLIFYIEEVRDTDRAVDPVHATQGPEPGSEIPPDVLGRALASFTICRD